jgi:O-methyltransferase
MNKLIREVVTGIGLDKPVRLVGRVLRAIGLAPRTSPLPEAAFRDGVRRAVEKLQALEPSEGPGDYLEFGVSRGASMAGAYQALRGEGLYHMRLIGFDSFDGMPEAERDSHSFKATLRHLKRRRVDLDRVMLVKGWYKDTLTEKTRESLQIGKVSLITIDCSIDSAAKDALIFCEPHIRQQAVIMFNRWGDPEEEGQAGQKEAFAGFLAEHPDLAAEPMPSYSPQARVFLVRRLASGIENRPAQHEVETPSNVIRLPRRAFR